MRGRNHPALRLDWLPRCPACGFELEGLAARGVCPECGEAYDEVTAQRVTALPSVWVVVRHLGFPLLVCAVAIAGTNVGLLAFHAIGGVWLVGWERYWMTEEVVGATSFLATTTGCATALVWFAARAMVLCNAVLDTRPRRVEEAGTARAAGCLANGVLATAMLAGVVVGGACVLGYCFLLLSSWAR